LTNPTTLVCAAADREAMHRTTTLMNFIAVKVFRITSKFKAIFQFDLFARITTTFGKGIATGRFILCTTCF
jgi:hypothetical protein